MSQSIETAAQQASESPEAVDRAVAASMSQPAPADPVQQQLLSHSGMLESLMSRISELEAIVATMEAKASGTADARLAELEGFAVNLVGSLQNHFSGKLALPAAPNSYSLTNAPTQE